MEKYLQLIILLSKQKSDDMLQVINQPTLHMNIWLKPFKF